MNDFNAQSTSAQAVAQRLKVRYIHPVNEGRFMVKEVKVVKLKKKWTPIFFPKPATPAEQHALDFMAVGMLTLAENTAAFVHKERGKKAQVLKERNAMAIALARLQAAWDSKKQASYREWVACFQKYGREARATEVYRSNRV